MIWVTDETFHLFLLGFPWVPTKIMLILAVGWCSNFKDENGPGSCSWRIILASIQWRPLNLHWWVIHNGRISGADQHYTRHFRLPVVHDWVSIHRRCRVYQRPMHVEEFSECILTSLQIVCFFCFTVLKLIPTKDSWGLGIYRLLPFCQLAMLCMCSSMANYLVIALFTSVKHRKE